MILCPQIYVASLPSSDMTCPQLGSMLLSKGIGRPLFHCRVEDLGGLLDR